MRLIDQQILANGTTIQLVENYSSTEIEKYSLVFVNRNTNDTVVNFIDSVDHAHCSPPNSVFFVNDSTGFFTESGGCYACYNWLFRTSDRGLTWTRIESGSRTEGNFFGRLNNDSFYMFNELLGIIIWEIKEGELVYSLTSDGGINWDTITQKINKELNTENIEHINFSADGQVTIICTDSFILETDRKKVNILQSNDFGKSFGMVK